MPKAKTKKPSAKKPVKNKQPQNSIVRAFKHSPILWSFIIFLVPSIGLYQANRQYIIYQERSDFKNAEIVVDGLVKDIQKELGESEVDIYKQCSYGTVKFEKKNLGCGFDYSFTYDVESADEANVLSRKFLLASKDFSVKPIPSFKDITYKEFQNSRGVESEQNGNDIIVENLKYIRCSISRVYSFDPFEKKQQYHITVSCHSKNNVKTNYYPLLN